MAPNCAVRTCTYCYFSPQNPEVEYSPKKIISAKISRHNIGNSLPGRKGSSGWNMGKRGMSSDCLEIFLKKIYSTF